MNNLTASAIPAAYRDINVVTTEIRTLQRQAQRMAIEYAIEVGERLNEAKGMLAHGDWEGWLKEEVNYSQDTAERLMKIASEKETISNSATLRNLSVTNALKLLALSPDDRKEVIENNDVENLSARELQKVIAERNAEKEAKEAAEKQRDSVIKQLAATESKLKAAERDNSAADAAKIKAEELKTQLDLLTKERDKLKEKAQAAEDKAKKAAKDIEELKAKPAEVSKEELAQISAEAKAAAEKALTDKLAAMEAEKTRAEAEADKLRRQLAQADTETTVFKTYFTQVQENFVKLEGSLTKIREASPETGEKLTKALKALLDSIEARI